VLERERIENPDGGNDQDDLLSECGLSIKALPKEKKESVEKGKQRWHTDSAFREKQPFSFN